jgi:hypothetical protein
MKKLQKELRALTTIQSNLIKELYSIDSKIHKIQLEIESKKINFFKKVENQLKTNDSQYNFYFGTLLRKAKNGDLEALHDLEIEFGERTVLQDWNNN